MDRKSTALAAPTASRQEAIEKCDERRLKLRVRGRENVQPFLFRNNARDDSFNCPEECVCFTTLRHVNCFNKMKVRPGPRDVEQDIAIGLS